MEGNESTFTIILPIFVYFMNFNTLASCKLATTPDINIAVDNSLYFQILEPDTLSYTFKIKPSQSFGAPFSDVYKSIDMVLSQPYEACSPLSNDVVGSVVMVTRGACSFLTKSYYAEKAGAVAVIIADNDHENNEALIDMVHDETKREISIPSSFLLGKDGAMIKNELENLGLQKAIITIPINITGILPHQAHRTPWTLWS
ncbi:hypothetical protein LOTGIDRAFT_238546 [Lottia gigantea]|uniref:PA domain-containing protein n=1 Tax=Lottia gigantea TaxID=225164 RepID=V4AT43_LOTGI|nr:hypothetical protein LOTGIDRAFT_238546 [Lottia gigantea]ESP00438.1 hypothetical protein LOTGIDRAFT_238546 [Lottia gigantea]